MNMNAFNQNPHLSHSQMYKNKAFCHFSSTWNRKFILALQILHGCSCFLLLWQQFYCGINRSRIVTDSRCYLNADPPFQILLHRDEQQVPRYYRGTCLYPALSSASSVRWRTHRSLFKATAFCSGRPQACLPQGRGKYRTWRSLQRGT